MFSILLGKIFKEREKKTDVKISSNLFYYFFNVNCQL